MVHKNIIICTGSVGSKLQGPHKRESALARTELTVVQKL